MRTLRWHRPAIPRLLALAVLAALTVAACSSSVSHGQGRPARSSGTTASTSTPGSQHSAPPKKTVWQQTIGQIRPDGTVSTTTALTAFAEAIGPLPGVTPPAGPTGDIPSGTIAVRWVFAHWAQLTTPQRAAVKADLGAPVVHHFTASGGTDAGSADDPNIDCQTKDTAGVDSYRKEFDGIVSLLTAHLWPLTVREHVFFADNTKTIDRHGKPANAYTIGCGPDTPDKIDGCTIHVNPGQVASNIHDILIHEMTHCFMADKFGPVGYSNLPAWYVEGGATWAMTDLGSGDSISLNYWHDYLNNHGLSLRDLSYDGVGFFVHLAETGTDVWKAIEPIGAAMTGSKNATAAGWNAAAPTEKFLNTWGSGYAEGRYPGDDWLTGGKTGGQHLDHYPTALLAYGLPNGRTQTLEGLEFGANLMNLDVQADVVQVTPLGGEHGLLSLGGGDSAPLDSTRNVNYCTLGADKCHCPKDSPDADAQFTPMNKGTEWISATNDTNGGSFELARVNGISMDDFCKSVPKLVGTWKTSAITGHVIDPGRTDTEVGGGGVQLTIDRNGHITATYTGMSPVTFTVNVLKVTVKGNDTWTGAQQGTILLPDRKTTHGTWSPLPGPDTVQVTDTITEPSETAGTQTCELANCLAQHVTPHMVGAIDKGTWAITGNTLTLNLTYQGTSGAATGQWTLTRVKKR